MYTNKDFLNGSGSSEESNKSQERGGLGALRLCFVYIILVQKKLQILKQNKKTDYHYQFL